LFTMSTQLPTDENGHPIPALRFAPGGAHVLAVSAASARLGPFAAKTRVISLYATGPVYLATGDATVTAGTSDHFFPAGSYQHISLGGDLQGRNRHTCLAAMRADGDCSLYVSEKE
ncbi:MAG: hypothetical protein WCJ64_16670, partial [Rhodospirillaceae bacterium]